MPIRANDPRPAFEQLADELRRAIRTRHYVLGGRIPSTRQLADAYDLAPMTVRNALQVLKDEGLVVGRQGRGVFVVAAPSPPPELDSIPAARAQIQAMMRLLEEIDRKLARLPAS